MSQSLDTNDAETAYACLNLAWESFTVELIAETNLAGH